MIHRMIQRKTAIAVLLIFVLGFSIGWYGRAYYLQRSGWIVSGAELLRNPDPNLNFINPLLGFEIADRPDQQSFGPLQEKIEEFSNTLLSQKKADRISVYFRDLVSGRWTGFRENEAYAPASMLKVLVMIAYLRIEEDQPHSLEKKIVNNIQEDLNQYAAYPPPVSIEPNKSYSIASLVERMIIHSGNNSMQLLVNHIETEKIKQVIESLRIRLPDGKTNFSGDFVSPKEFSLVFRVLYNATYLSRKMSQQALTLLSKTMFDKGLKSGLPSDVAVAHKFGERTAYTPGISAPQYRELHDCGIVYAKSPYFLCVMTQGKNFADLEGIIAEYSRLVYENAAQ